MHETGCKWRLRAYKKKSHQMFEITVYEGPHTYVFLALTQDHSNMDAKFIAIHVKGLVRVDPSIKIVVIVQHIREDFNYTITYKKAWHAKQKALALAFGDWDESYAELPKFLNALSHYNEGSKLIVKGILQPVVDPDTDLVEHFQRPFWTLKASIDRFVHCRPVVSVDGTHLYSKYKGKMLIAMGSDANNQIFPFAFAVVNEENTDNWEWFLRLLKIYVLRDREHICLISDRHAGTQVHKVMENIKKRDEDVWQYLTEIDKTKWTLAFDGGCRYGIVTTNMSEVFNGVLKGARNLPITASMRLIFYRFVSYFTRMRDNAASARESCVMHMPLAYKAITQYKDKATSHQVTTFDRARGLVDVMTSKGNIQVVDLNERNCSCGKWQIYRWSCSRVMAAFVHLKLDVNAAIDSYYTLDEYERTWAPIIFPIQHSDYWPHFERVKLLPDPNLRRDAKGRPVSTRIQNEMVWGEGRRTRRCGRCREVGHDQRKCPSRARAAPTLHH